MAEQRSILSLAPCCEIAPASDWQGTGGPWSDQEWMYDRIAIRQQSLMLFGLVHGRHQIRFVLHDHQPDFSNEAHADWGDWAHVVECTWTLTDPVELPAADSIQGNQPEPLKLDAGTRRVHYRVGWFDPEKMPDAAWGTRPAEVHLWPMRDKTGETHVLKLWDGEAPDLPAPPNHARGSLANGWILLAEWLTCLVLLSLLIGLPLAGLYGVWRFVSRLIWG